MAQIFSPGATTLFRTLLFVIAAVIVGLFALGKAPRLSYVSNEDVVRQQPVQFSHRHHVGDDGIDCRYCHTSVETTAFAGIPATEICMNCHRQLWLNSPMLAPVLESYRTGAPLRWTRVHDLPGFVYFYHGIHVQKGIGCSTCHGRVDQMPLTRTVQPLTMEWCLDCHRHPERHVRPRAEVFNMEWEPLPGAQQEAAGRKLVQEYAIKDAAQLTSCSTCHR